MTKERYIFISYRQIDGSDLASWIYQRLQGESIVVNSESFVLSPHLDKAIPSGSNWMTYLDNKLENSGSLIIVCSPHTLKKYDDREDYFYHEIEWWIKNRISSPPLLVATEDYGYLYVPKIINETWGDIQVAKLSSSTLNYPSQEKLNDNGSIFLQSLTLGITSQINPGTKLNFGTNILSSEFNIDGFASWAKDRHGRYIYANEYYARAAGCDSPTAMLGKTDHKMAWHSLAEKFREGDRAIMFEDPLLRTKGVIEKEIMAEKIADIFVKEGVFKDNCGRVIGVAGCFLDVTEGLKGLKASAYKIDQFGLHLPGEFGCQHLETIEINVLQGILRNMTRNEIAISICKPNSEVRVIVQSLKKKFQCTTDQQLLISAIRAGVPLRLFE